MPDYLTLDLTLAILHHLMVFALAGIIAYELAAVRIGIDGAAIARIARVDALYGLLAVGIVAAGLARAVYAAKGWEYYAGNHWFWAKMGAFAVLGLLSIMPTVAFIRWRRAVRANPAFSPDERQVRAVRRHLWMEVAVFGAIPAFAAAMARIA
jgi:putative membrane protein